MSARAQILVPKEEGDEENRKCKECIQLLHAAGYYRARVESIPIFDRVVGGIVWCISKCDFKVDVNILYQENMSYKRKIPISEALSAALVKLKCPHTLAPHEVIGLDYARVFQVIQWLVQTSLDVDTKDSLKTFSNWFSAFSGSQVEEARHEFRFLVRNMHNSSDVSRKFKRPNNMTDLELEEDVRCTIREYTQKGASSRREEADSDDDPQGDTDSIENLTKISLQRFQIILEEANLSEGNRKKMEVIRMTGHLTAQLENLAGKIEHSAMLFMKEKLENEEMSFKWKKVETTLAESSGGDDHRMKDLMNSYYETKNKSTILHTILYQNFEELQNRIRMARLNLDENGKPKPYDVSARDAIDELERVKEERRESAREVCRLQEALDRSLTNTIRTQYIHRELERATDTLQMNMQAKQAVSEHNLTHDILNITTRIQLLNDQIDESLRNDLLDAKKYNFLLKILHDSKSKLEDYHQKGIIVLNKLESEKKIVEKRKRKLTKKHRETQGKADYLNRMVDVNNRLQMFKDALDRAAIQVA